ncbi:hypothetical protein [Paraburkholderia graminis]|uniref:Alanine dehydrogenase n=1 Tax=Paraburkholderia graminis TaxID=60548 RepID=A0ABD5CF83_9BURK|nr:alanine dehydrogenase [Paraburkholderia graminis]
MGTILVQSRAGAEIGLADEAYVAAGAALGEKVGEIHSRADMIIKVNEPQAAERAMLRPGQILDVAVATSGTMVTGANARASTFPIRWIRTQVTLCA